MIKPDFINYIDFDVMEKMCHPIAVALFDSSNEPMTHFGKHDRALLESALNNPRQIFDKKELYPTFVKKAAILYYGLIKNHPFENGNKRTATVTLLTFLFINNFRLLDADIIIEDYLVELAKRVAISEGSIQKDGFLKEIETWLAEHLVEPKR